MASAVTELQHPKLVPEAEWLSARKELLAKEKEFTRLRDELSRQRRELPWQMVAKQYQFEGRSGKVSLGDLFDGRSQLIVYHFMLGPGWSEGCRGCSFLGDHFDGLTIHLANRDTTLVVVSRAPLVEIETFKKRMGWRFRWVSSFESDFNYDYHVSFAKDEITKDKVYYNYDVREFPSDEAPGASVFYKEENGDIFHTYSTYGRGLDIFLGTYNFLDITPKGRDEGGLASTMEWLRHHDRYSEGYFVDSAEPAALKAEAAGCCSGADYSQ